MPELALGLGNKPHELSCIMMQFQIHVVSMDHFAWSEEAQTLKDVWKSALVGGGELFAMTNGTTPMLLSFANSSGTPQMVILLLPILSPTGKKTQRCIT